MARRKAASVTPADDLSRGRRTGHADTQLGVRIRQARTAAGLSQEELAGRIGISCQQLQKYEAAVNRVTVSRLIDISDALRLDVTKLLTDGGAKPVSDNGTFHRTDIVRLVNSFCGIRNATSRLKVIELAEFLEKLEAAAPRD